MRGSDGSFDIRKAATGYVHILAGMGGIVVAALVLIFTSASEHGAHDHRAQLTFATGLLALGLVGCTAGAFGFAALSGEQKLTPNIPAAGMYIGAGVAIGVVAILAAFEVLASAYLPQSRILFGGIVAGSGIMSSVYNGFTVIDEWELRMSDAALGPSTWLATRNQAQTWAKRLAVLGGVPVIVAYALFCAHEDFGQSATLASLFVGAGLVVVVGSLVLGSIRSLHDPDNEDSGIQRNTAMALQIVVSAYISALLILLPR